MTKLNLNAILCLLLSGSVQIDGFKFTGTALSNIRSNSKEGLMMSMTDEQNRRDLIQKAVGTLATGVATVAFSPAEPALAAGLKSVNSYRASYGLPLLPDNYIPSGLTAVVDFLGKDGFKEPLLVSFAYPKTWVVQRPSITPNGEDGTLEAGNYQKGDRAAVYVGPGIGSETLESKPKKFFEDILIAGISQKGDNQYQNFKLTKLTKSDIPREPGQTNDYYLAEFKYELLTGAGFTVDRRGCASITASGEKSTQAFIIATTETRYKSLGDDIKASAKSFRVNAGLKAPISDIVPQLKK